MIIIIKNTVVFFHYNFFFEKTFNNSTVKHTKLD